MPNAETAPSPGPNDEDFGSEPPTGLVRRLEQQLDDVRNERDSARRQLRRIQSSASYRTSRAISWLPRKLRAGWRRLKKLTAKHRPIGDAGPKAGVAGPAARPFAPSVNRPGPPRSATPDVTVIIPVYNSELWLDDCLSSVLAQTGVALEVVCVNDGSTDGSRRVLQRYADEDPRMTIIDQANSGQSVGRNVGLDAAAGRYVIYLDSDDFWPGDTLAALVRRADAEHLDVLLFDCLAFRDGDIPESTWERYSTYYQRSREYREVRTGAQMIADMRRHRDYRPHVGMYIARTGFVRRVGTRFIAGIVHQDNPYTFTLLLNAARVAHWKDDVYARRMRPGSTITSLKDAQSAKGYFLSYLAMTREVTGREFDSDITDMLTDVIYGVFNGAHQKFSVLPLSALSDLKALDRKPDAQIAFRTLTSANIRS